MVEILQPFNLPPTLNLKFSIGTKIYDFELTLPVCITHFIESVNMVGNDFKDRWQKLSDNSQQKQEVLQANKPTMAAFVSQIFSDSNMFVLSDLSSESNVCAVGTLRTGSVSAK